VVGIAVWWFWRAAPGLAVLAGRHVKALTDIGVNPAAKVMAVVAGMVMGVESIDDVGVVRVDAIGEVAAFGYAPSILGQFLRRFTFGYMRQVDAARSRLTRGLAATRACPGTLGRPGAVMVGHQTGRHQGRLGVCR
jgi:hypothetical protein